MARIEWTSRAFAVLENLPQKVAFEIIRQVDTLVVFPELGAKMESRFPTLKPCLQLIIKRKYRVIYDFD